MGKADARPALLIQFYTHVAIRTLRAIHQATHPGRQTDKEGAVANDEAAVQDKTTSAE
ncbi:MAG: hypothetical protein Q7J84_03680 [Sulfuricaulis sp.]|nr:hypothetical protein [Sulfuricaulis sp.]